MTTLRAMLSMTAISALLVLSGSCTLQHSEVQWSLLLQGNGYRISANSFRTQYNDGTDFGDAVVGGAPVVREFEIINPHSMEVVLENQQGWRFEGGDENDFAFVGTTPQRLAGGERQLVRIQFQPRALGLRTTMVTAAYRSVNHGTTQTIAFRIQGRGVSTGTISISSAAVGTMAKVVTNGSLLVDESLGTDFGEVARSQGESSRTHFTISNVADAGVLRVGSIRIHGPNSGEFQVSQGEPTSLSVGESQDFTITFTPHGERLGQRQALVVVPSSDPRRPLYSFLVSATVIPAADG